MGAMAITLFLLSSHLLKARHEKWNEVHAARLGSETDDCFRMGLFRGMRRLRQL
jgi:hypothetical protein